MHDFAYVIQSMFRIQAGCRLWLIAQYKQLYPILKGYKQHLICFTQHDETRQSTQWAPGYTF